MLLIVKNSLILDLLGLITVAVALIFSFQLIRISLGILVLDLVEYHKQPCQLEAKNQEKSSSFEGDDNKKKSINDEFQLADQPEKGCCRAKGRGGWQRFYQDQLRRGRPFTEHELEDYIKCIERSEVYRFIHTICYTSFSPYINPFCAYVCMDGYSFHFWYYSFLKRTGV